MCERVASPSARIRGGSIRSPCRIVQRRSDLRPSARRGEVGCSAARLRLVVRDQTSSARSSGVARLGEGIRWTRTAARCVPSELRRRRGVSSLRVWASSCAISSSSAARRNATLANAWSAAFERKLASTLDVSGGAPVAQERPRRRAALWGRWPRARARGVRCSCRRSGAARRS